MSGVLGLMCMLLAGCQSGLRPAGVSGLPAARVEAKAVASEVREVTTEISNANAILSTVVEQVAPDAAKHTAAIDGGVVRLRAVEARLGGLEVSMASETGKAAQQAKALTAAQQRVAELEAKGSGLLTYALAGLAVVGLLLALAGAVWLRSVHLAVAGAALFVLCIIGQVILAYRIELAIGAGVVAAGYIAYTVWRQRKSFVQVVATVEAIKDTSLMPVPVVFTQRANTIQDGGTKAAVDAAQRALRVVRRGKAKQAGASE